MNDTVKAIQDFTEFIVNFIKMIMDFFKSLGGGAEEDAE